MSQRLLASMLRSTSGKLAVVASAAVLAFFGFVFRGGMLLSEAQERQDPLPPLKVCYIYELTSEFSDAHPTVAARLGRMYGLDRPNIGLRPEMSTRPRSLRVNDQLVPVKACHYLSGDSGETPTSETCLVPASATACPDMFECCNPGFAYTEQMRRTVQEFHQANDWINVNVDPAMKADCPGCRERLIYSTDRITVRTVG